MCTSNLITAAAFSAFIKCPMKAHLLVVGLSSPGTFFANMDACILSMYRAAAKQRLRTASEVAEACDFVQLWNSPDYSVIKRHVDCETAIYDFALPPHKLESRLPRKSKPSGTFVPVLLSPWDKLDVSGSLIVCFAALALSQVTGTLADAGILIYGEDYRRRTVKIGDHLAQTRQMIKAMAATCCGQEPPPLILNKHCAVCDFQPRCRSLAVERDDLSLLDAMTAKERTKCNAKGIFTITQLSYGYRPRRRKRARPDAEPSGKTCYFLYPKRHQTQGLGNQEEPDTCCRSTDAKV